MSTVEVEYLSRCDIKGEHLTDYSSRSVSPLADYLSRVFPTLDLPKMELDPESLLRLIAGQRSAPKTAVTSESSENASWRPILGCGHASRTEGSESSHDFGFDLPAMELLSMSSHQPSAIEQMGLAVEDHSRQQTLEARSRDLFHRLLQASASVAQSKRHVTITQRVLVPSSDHVAEIVGKNGLRIKQIREHLKVWVKTPTRDEPPVFEVTGVPDKVTQAVRILQQMSEHFSRVQQERQTRTEPTRVEERLWVEQDKVGLIVGASGQTIRWIQQLSDTHIATPRKQERQPGLRTCFTVSGTRERVQFAKQLISEYVALRCQGLWLEASLPRSSEALRLVADFHQLRLGKADGPAAPEVTVTPAVAASVPAAAPPVTAEDQLLQDARRLWPEPERPRRLWHSALFFGGLGLAEQRRYSADTPISPITPAIGAAAADWPTPDPQAAMKKAQSDEQIGSVGEAAAAITGWM